MTKFYRPRLPMKRDIGLKRGGEEWGTAGVGPGELKRRWGGGGRGGQGTAPIY